MLDPGTRLGAYEIVGAIGAGGMGEVYRARDERLGRDVAIKILPAAVATDDRLHRFEQEARAAAALNHPNILAVYDVGRHGDVAYMVAELLEGDALRDRLHGAALPARKAVELAVQIARGLAAAHEKGIVHRDLKPENVFVTADGRVKILDFGLAKVTQGEPAVAGAASLVPTAAPATSPGVVLGTVGYMAPEQVRGQAADPRTDIFAFGAILYEMLAGRRAFRGDTSAEMMTAILREDPPDLPAIDSLPAALARIVNRCLEKNPSARFQSAGDLAFALGALTAASGERSAVAAGSRTRLARAAIAAVAAATTVAIAIAAALATRPSSSAVEPVHFTIEVPRNHRTAEPGAVISPDGSQIAFVATDASGHDVLWVRRLGALDAAALAGTAGAHFPFWSPDSQWIGFFADGELKKIPAAGGAAQTLTRAPRAWGGSWSPNGTIVFAPELRSPLYRVSDQGGESVPVTRLPASTLAGHLFPSFLPDGVHFVFTEYQSGIYVGSLNSLESRPLLPSSQSNAVVTANGYVLYAEGGAVKAQRVDLDRLELSGATSVLAEGVARTDDNAAPIVSASATGSIVYAAGDASLTELVWIDRAGRPLRTVGPVGNYVAPALSPDGTRVAVGRDGDLWLIDMTRNDTATRLTSSPGREYYPVWSPDGRRIVYAAAGQDGPSGLFHVLASGVGEPELLVSGVAPFEWSRDGRLLTYFDFDRETGDDAYVLPIVGEREPIEFLRTRFHEYEHRLSPDATWMVYASEESGRPEIYLQTFPASEERIQISTAGGVQPMWRADGRELYYLGLDGNLMAVDITTTPSLVVGVPEPLLPVRSLILYTRSSYAPSADGQRFLINSYRAGDASSVGVMLNWPAALPESSR